jgi:hypothetical protein
MIDYSSLIIAVATVGVLALLLRWAFGRGRSLVENRPMKGHPWEYGLLVSVAAPVTYEEGERLLRWLAEHGVRATITVTEDGPRVFVFADDETRARALLRRD